MFFKKNIKYTKTITAKYTGTTMDLRKGYFYINCEYLDENYKYKFISEPLAIDPQDYIKKHNIKTFEVQLAEKNGETNFDKYRINVDEILEYLESLDDSLYE